MLLSGMTEDWVKRKPLHRGISFHEERPLLSVLLPLGGAQRGWVRYPSLLEMKKKCSSVERCKGFGRGCFPPKMNLTFYAFSSRRARDVLSFNRQESIPPRCACSRYLPAPASHSLPEGRRPHRRMQARAFPALARHVLLLWSKQNSSLSPGHRIVTEDSVCSPHLWKKKKGQSYLGGGEQRKRDSL